MQNELNLRDLAIGDAGWIASRHGTLYAEHEGFDASFEALVMRILADFIENRDPVTDRAFIAEVGGARVGSVFCVRDDPATARLRMFFLEPECRGKGYAAPMLEAVIDHARATGAERLVLWTHKSHRAACALYARRGFRVTEERATRSFGQDVVEQSMELAL
ncbi:acetyltransferase (GNAT) family protein [Litoreibacter ponti]|uniref:Acetyltransferase (GNAT) family protein n=1 Tax=Litoreibacter ponti TaxID=1510457 RepID=A0A2T6BKS9_9RHOB|nr:GNAT family N-acetyltransferase [Litoreibacter ponti]PTX56667.1 acetyltransferase (GNAT) family protein [Litoreibacter ponti]